jgi:flagellar biosynthetic protein FlhB
MADTDNDQKTELASEKHINEAFEQGQFARSQEIQTVFTLAAVILVLGLTTSQCGRDLGELTVSIFSQLAKLRIDADSVPAQFTGIIMLMGQMLLPILGTCAIAALLAGGLQTGFRVTPKVFALRFENLSPATGFGRVFSKAALVRAGLDVLKLVAVGFALRSGLNALMDDPLFSAPIELAYLGEFLQHAAVAFFTRMLLALGIIGAIGYAYEVFKTRKDLMMTRQQVKDERRQSDGDAMVKAVMRRMARRLMRKQMLAAVPTADVVLTNPTHYAVALKYERGLDRAPVVLAKGENQFARRIKAIAAEHGVPMVENKPVAQMLFALGEVGETIPSPLYQAVAEILAVVYRTHRYYFHQLKIRRLTASVADNATEGTA